MEKSPTPNLPTATHVLEDILDPTFITEEYPKELPLDSDEQLNLNCSLLNNAYACFLNLKQLEGDIKKQTELKWKLTELNEKLVENIANLKTQASKEE